MVFLFYGVLIPDEIYFAEIVKYNLRDKHIDFKGLSNKQIFQLYIDILDKENGTEEDTKEVKEIYEENPLKLVLEDIDTVAPKEIENYMRYLETHVFIRIKVEIENDYVLDPLEEIKQEDINKLNNLLTKYHLDSFAPKLYVCTSEFPDILTKIKEGKNKM
jgi:hypothetical protein